MPGAMMTPRTLSHGRIGSHSQPGSRKHVMSSKNAPKLGSMRPALLGGARFRTAALLAVAFTLLLPGCGGGGGGLGLSGGSIPGGGTITGKIALPSGGTLTSATTTATSLSTGAALAVSTSIDSSGYFTITKVPTATDIDLTFTHASTTLKTIVPSHVVSA